MAGPPVSLTAYDCDGPVPPALADGLAGGLVGRDQPRGPILDLPAAARAKFKANALKYPADAARGTSAKYTELPSDAVVCTGEPSTDPSRDAQAAAENAHYD